MFRHIPNALTAARLVLAAIFFGMLGFYQYQGQGSPYLLNLAFGVYVVALATDFLDGYLARRWKVEGIFGRVVDPFVDKVLVIGSFIFFAGKNFIIPDDGGQHFIVKTITGVAPWMVVVILARELLVTSFRGIAENSGKNFGAEFTGKLKMGFQSGTILAILIYVNYLDRLRNSGYEACARIIREIGIWGTLVLTLGSGWAYVRKAMIVFRQSQPAKNG